MTISVHEDGLTFFKSASVGAHDAAAASLAST